jgi:hypothetical protein
VIARLALLLWLQGQAPRYADSATALLIARARERHVQQDAAVHDYQATLVTRTDASVGRGAFARLLPIAVEEQKAELWWQAPNDVKVVTVGRRFRTALRNADVNSSWDRPWFVPRFLGDSIRLLSGEDFPERAAVHPLSAGAERYYRYAINDSMTLALPGRTVRAIGVQVTPAQADASLIAGELWLDAETAETVRLSFVFVGKRLWIDSIGPTRRDTTRADRNAALVQNILRVSADLEYGLYDRRYWLPYRQAVTLDVQLPWFKNLVIPVHFITTFSDVRVNESRPITFTELPPDTAKHDGGRRRGPVTTRCGDTLALGSDAVRLAERAANRDRGGCVTVGVWPGGRFEVDVPKDSALLAYAGWTDSLDFDLSSADADRLEEFRRDVLTTLQRLPDSLTGQRRRGLAFDRLTDIWRYNRAEGASLGLGYEWRPGIAFVSVLAKVRYAFTDARLQGSLALRRDGLASRWEAVLFREMRDGDFLAPGLSFANSTTALWLARDDGDYVFMEGGEVRYQERLGRAADLTLQARLADESAPPFLARSGLNALLGGGGGFAANGPVAAGRYAVAGAELSAGGTPLETQLEWRAGLEGTVGPRRAGRAWLVATASTAPESPLAVTVSGWAGIGAGDSIPQREFRLGGLQSLRGYAAGAFRGGSAWTASLDVGLSRGVVSPVVFVDAGEVAPRLARFSGRLAFSYGAGLSLLGGVLRVDGARPVAPHATWRLNLTLGARR